jgi:hypothetical protein
MFRLRCLFATDNSYGIHPHHGVPQLYFNQLNVIAQHLQGDSIQDNDITKHLHGVFMHQTTGTINTSSTPETVETADTPPIQLRKCSNWP